MKFPGQKEGDTKYCYDAATKARFKQWMDKKASTEPQTVGYILKTATNWNGPIGEFHLKVTAPKDDLFSFCAPDGLKPTGDGVTWEAKNFVPRQHLESSSTNSKPNSAIRPGNRRRSYWFAKSLKSIRAGSVSGLPGFVTLEAGGELQTTAFDIEDGKIAAPARRTLSQGRARVNRGYSAQGKNVR